MSLCTLFFFFAHVADSLSSTPAKEQSPGFMARERQNIFIPAAVEEQVSRKKKKPSSSALGTLMLLMFYWQSTVRV